MIEFLNGRLDYISDGSIVVEVNGMGYELLVTSSVLGRLPGIGGEIKIYTYLQAKEDGVCLFGFSTRDELALFKQLITVSGIGPKGALSILSFMSVDDLRFAILAEDSKTISRAPGIGAKTAGKLIIELKDKVKNYAANTDRGMDVGESAAAPGSNVRDEAAQALISLGYSATEAMKAVNNVTLEAGMTVEDILKQSLKKVRL